MITYEVVYFDGWSDVPAYLLAGAVEGDTPEQAPANNRERLINMVRESLSLDDLPDHHILETLYIIREGGLLLAHP